MDKTFIEKLTQIKESHNSKDFGTLKDELAAYKNIIPEFFSRNGEASGIRSMYERVNSSDFNNVTINATDLHITESMYSDYLNGMYTFVQDLNTAVIRESDVDSYKDKLNMARENDSTFIESIFGGSLNPEAEFTIRESADNLEVLIDFIPQIDNFYNKSLILSESMSAENELVNSSIEMICESVSNYTYNIIKNVMNNYYSILESFEEKEEPTTDNFVLFY